jgi:hypothetical protein
MMVSANEFHAANKRALQRMAKAVRAVSAKVRPSIWDGHGAVEQWLVLAVQAA